MIDEHLNINVTDIELQPIEAVTSYLERSVKKQADGSVVTIVKQKRYKPARIKVSFKATVDVKLIKNGLYTDRLNHFIAISENQICNVETEIVSFQIPKQLLLIAHTFTEKQF